MSNRTCRSIWADTAPQSKTQPTVGVLHSRMCGNDGSIKLAKAGWLCHKKKAVPQWQAFSKGWCEAGWLASESQRCTCKHVLERWVTCEWKSTMHLQARSWEVSDLWVKIKSRTWQARSWRCSWLASVRAAVLLVDTSKAMQEQALQVWAWNIQKQQYRWRWRQVLERCCRGSSRGETD